MLALQTKQDRSWAAESPDVGAAWLWIPASPAHLAVCPGQVPEPLWASAAPSGTQPTSKVKAATQRSILLAPSYAGPHQGCSCTDIPHPWRQRPWPSPNPPHLAGACKPLELSCTTVHAQLAYPDPGKTAYWGLARRLFLQKTAVEPGWPQGPRVLASDSS